MHYPFSIKQPFELINTPAASSPGPSYWFIYRGNDLLLLEHDQQLTIPCTSKVPVAVSEIVYSRCIGSYSNSSCMAVEISQDAVLDDTFTGVSLRQAHGHISGDLWNIAGRAIQIIAWNHHNQFCGRCGSPMQELYNEMQKSCMRCEFISYPRISPAVIMSVLRGNTILLGRAPRFPAGMYSTLAGFVEPGEVLEEAVRREVKEETNIDVTDIRYIASQAWPFPHSLMIGFTCRYAGGELEINKAELEDANWFTPDAMPQLPSKLSVARALIDHFLADRAAPSSKNKRSSPSRANQGNR